MGYDMKKWFVKHSWWFVALVALAMLILHVFQLGTLQIDTTSIVLLLIILISPFVSAIKKIKFGDFEAEIDPAEVRKIKEQMEMIPPTDTSAGFSRPSTRGPEQEIRELVDLDPVLALAKLRIELEKTLTKLFNLTQDGSLRHRMVSAGRMAHILAGQELIPARSSQPLRDVLQICNRAIHGEEIREDDAREIVEIGTSLLDEIIYITYEIHMGVLDSEQIDQDVIREFMEAEYRVETITPLVESPTKNTRLLSQDGLDELLDGYGEYAEFIVRVEKVDQEEEG